MMMMSLAASQPLDYTLPAVLDLRKVKSDNGCGGGGVCDSGGQMMSHINTQGMLQTCPSMSMLIKSPTSPSEICFPTSTYFSGNNNQTAQRIHVDSSEDGFSENGSVSPSSISSPFSITSSIMYSRASRSGKPTRPFKAYPKDPLALPAVSSADAILGHASTEAYTEFRRRLLSQVQAATGYNTSNSKMKRSASPPSPSSCSDAEGKDAAYWERRRKNNEAAKRSRDARRAKEDEIAIRAAFLEQENIQLKYENASLKNEANKLKCLLYNR